MTKEISIREKISSYRCLKLENIDESDLKEIANWASRNYFKPYNLLFKVTKAYVLRNDKLEEQTTQTLSFQAETSGDYPDRISEEIDSFAYYLVYNDSSYYLYTEEEFNKEFEITQEPTQ